MKSKVIIIAGPTGSGKSSLAIQLAKKVNGEIISCDSMQIYRNMDIGTAKVTEKEKSGVVHHMIDIISPKENFSVQDFQKQCKKLIREIHDRGNLPILAGGTGLYINSILYDYDFSQVKPHPEFRKKLEAAYEIDPIQLLEKLNKIDKNLYSSLNIKDKKKIIRALEVYEFSGKTISVDSKINQDYEFFLFVLNDKREKLYEKINQRVDLMLNNGLINEVDSLLSNGLNENHQSMKAIGYREVILYLQNKIDYQTMVDTLKQNTRKYAKRQLTWFRKNKNAIWLDKSESSQEEILIKILEEINEFWICQ